MFTEEQLSWCFFHGINKVVKLKMKENVCANCIPNLNTVFELRNWNCNAHFRRKNIFAVIIFL